MSLKLGIYNASCVNLARSIIVKSDLLAKEVEMQVRGTYGYLGYPRNTWLYYMNLAGQYHEVNERMVITSHDTLLEIDFTKENLKHHTITKSKYTATSDLTKALIRKHPNNATLIQGIIYNIDIDEAIEAEDYTILAYEKQLVNPQELDLIFKVQNALKRKFSNPLNLDYLDVEDGYIDVIMWKVYQSLPYEIKFARMANHHTAWASEFDMWLYINSHIYLEDLNYALSHSDVVYLYKNIARLCSNSGSNTVLHEIIEHFLSSRGIDTYQLDILRDLKSIDDLEPKHEIKLIERQLNGSDVREATLLDYDHLGRSRSHTEIVNYPDGLHQRMKYSDDRLSTRELKILEILENSSDTQLLLTDIDLFVQAVALERFSSRHTITNHLTGDNYSLTSIEAIILYMYVVGCKLGGPTEYITTYDTFIVPEPELPKVDDYINDYGLTEEEAEGLLDLVVPYPDEGMVPSDLVDYIRKYKDSIPSIRLYLASLTNYNNQIMMSKVESSLYCYINVELISEVKVKYEDWLFNHLINLKEFTTADYVLFEENILRSVFDLDLAERTSHRSIGIAELIKRFCSYRLNVTARADSANMINYFLRPIQSHSQVTTPGYLVDDIPCGIDLVSSVPSYNIIIESGTVGELLEPSISEKQPLLVSYTMTGGSCTSTVTTPPADRSLLGSMGLPDVLIKEV